MRGDSTGSADGSLIDLTDKVTLFENGGNGGIISTPSELPRFSCGTFYGHEGGVNGTASIALVPPDGVGGAVIALNLRSGADPCLAGLAEDMLCST